MARPTQAQVDAVIRLLNEAYGPMFAIAAPGTGSSSIPFWAPRIAQAVIDASDGN